jgi:nucleotide-binding universal stress UspA family protein
VEHSIVDDEEQRELRALVKQVKSENCVLVLGPRIAVRASDPKGPTLDEILAGELLVGLNKAAGDRPPNLRDAAELHYTEHGTRSRLEVEVEEFYARESELSTEFHLDLAELPFRLCISASPDSLMLNAFRKAGKLPQTDYYRFQPQRCSKRTARLAVPTVNNPLVYYLFGHHKEGASLVLREADLIDYLVQIIKFETSVPDEVRSILKDPNTSFLFLGFGFQNWYLRVLLKVLDVYGPRDKVAFEDDRFFDLPEGQHAIAYFSGDPARRIEFRHLRWETFARQLRRVYEASLAPSYAAEATPTPPPDAPCAFLSYAGEDIESVNALAERLESNGVRVWQDKQNLRAGDRWNEVLLSVIKDEEKVDYVIVVQTIAMVTARRGVFRREIEAALEVHRDMGEYEGQRLRFVIPVTIGDCEPLFSLKELHTIDITEPSGVNQLVASIKEDWKKREKLPVRQRRAA